MIKEYNPNYYATEKKFKPDFGGNDGQYEIERLRNIYDILDDVIDTMDIGVLNEILKHYEKDIDLLFDDVVATAYRILYGRDTRAKVKPTLRYLKSVDETLKEQMRIHSISYFCSETLGMEMNWHHIEWSWMVENFAMICVLAARDHGKSFFFSHGYPIWMMYKYDKMARVHSRLNGRLGYIFSNTLPQAVDLLEIIKDSIEDTDILRERLFGGGRDNWSKVSIKTKNGCRLRVRGMGSTVRGAHPGYLVLDDTLKDNVLYSKIIRDRNKDYFNGAILNMLPPYGQLIGVGTPFHKDDMYSIFRNSVDFAYREYPAIDKHGTLLWKGRHSQIDLDMRRRLMGAALFTREFLVQPVSSETAIFPEKLLKRSIFGMEVFSYVPNRKAFPIKFKKVVVGGDFAISGRVQADYTSFVVFGLDESGNMWLIYHYHRQGVGYSEQKRELRRIWRDFRPDIIFLEANQFQSIYTETLAEETDMPVKPYVTGTRKHSLSDGVPGLAILFENGKIRFPYRTELDKKKTEAVLEEFRNIGWTEKGIQGVGEHDDIVMSIWIARMAHLLGGGEFVFDFAEAA